MRLQVKNFMSAPVNTCSVHADVASVRMKMEEKKYGAMPIVEEVDGQMLLKGIVTVKDLAGIYDNIGVKQVMKEKVVIVHPDASVQACAQLMLKKQLHHLVVMENGEIVGMVSSADFIRLVAEFHLEA